MAWGDAGAAEGVATIQPDHIEEERFAGGAVQGLAASLGRAKAIRAGGWLCLLGLPQHLLSRDGLRARGYRLWVCDVRAERTSR